MSDPSGAVANLELAETPPELAGLSFLPSTHAARMGLAAGPDQQPASGAVAGNNIVSFVSGLTAQHQTDVLNSTLFCQLASDKQKNRWDDPVGWYKQYSNYMRTIGWSPGGESAASYSNPQAQGFTVGEVILEGLRKLATAGELAVVTATLDALTTLDQDDGRVQLFQQSSVKGKNGIFQTAVASETSGAVAVKMAAFYFESNNGVTDVLGHRFTSSLTRFDYATRPFALDDSKYGDARDAIQQKLGSMAQDLIASIDL